MDHVAVESCICKWLCFCQDQTAGGGRLDQSTCVWERFFKNLVKLKLLSIYTCEFSCFRIIHLNELGSHLSGKKANLPYFFDQMPWLLFLFFPVHFSAANYLRAASNQRNAVCPIASKTCRSGPTASKLYRPFACVEIRRPFVITPFMTSARAARTRSSPFSCRKEMSACSRTLIVRVHVQSHFSGCACVMSKYRSSIWFFFSAVSWEETIFSLLSISLRVSHW